MKGRHFLILISCIALTTVIWLASSFFRLGGAGYTGGTYPHEEMMDSGYDADTAQIMEVLRGHGSNATGDSLLKVMLDKSRSARFVRGIFESATGLGEYYRQRDSFLQALYYYDIALPYIEYPENIKKAASVYRKTATCHSDIGQYSIALNYYNKALAAIGKADQTTKSDDSFDVYSGLAMTWYELGEHAYSLRAFRLAHDISVRKKDPQMIVMSLGNIAETYARNKQLDSAKAYFRQVLHLAENYDFKMYQVQALGSLSQFALKEKNYPQAMAYIMRCLSDSLAAAQGPYVKITTLRALGILYKEMNRLDTAEIIFTNALADAKALHIESHVAHLESSLALLYAAAGKYEQAYRHLLQYTDIRDSLVLQEKAHVLEAWSNSRIAEKDKEMLRQQLYISQQRNELQGKNLLIIGTLLGAIILIVTSTVLIRSYRHKQALQQSRIAQLEQKNEIHLLKAKMQGEEQERSRIGRELHDNIASQLWAIKLHIDDMQHDENLVPAQQQKLAFLYRELEHASQDVRKTAHNLMPDLLLEEGLATAMASLCEKTRKNTTLNIDFQEYGTIPELDREIELSIYRMFQELVQNVLKHAENATHMLVQLSCNDLLLSLTVEDNGKGIAHIHDGVGLQQIRKRAQTLGAHFDLKSNPGHGTTAYFELDLRQIL